MTSDWRNDLPQGDGVVVLRDEPMALHTTYKVGGTAAAFLKLKSLEALCEAVDYLTQNNVPFVVVGNGSNVLFSDTHFAGAVLQLSKGFDNLAIQEDNTLRVGAAVTINKLVRFTKQKKLSGVEFLGGVPGTVGGAVRMNAGTTMGEVKDTLVRARIVSPGQPARWLNADQLNLSYRHSELPRNAIVVEAEFTCNPADEETFSRLEQVLSYRKETQPLQLPSCGSVFANPPGDHAGRLIEACGLKGQKVGGAQISEMHANWIVNIDQAKASDVNALIELCISSVKDQFGINLRHEVQYLGDWTGA